MASFKWDPNAIKKLTQEVVGNLDKGLRGAVESTVCPDHHQATRLVRKGDGWHIEGCCEKAVRLAERNVSRALK
jgi:hypothetical protein